jgi:hypothetical protein
MKNNLFQEAMPITNLFQSTFENLDLNKIKIPEFQRNVDMLRIKKIAKDFDPKKVGVLTVSHRNGEYWIIDGQHRLVTLKTLGYHVWTCEVFRGLTYIEEAKLFDTQMENKRDIDIIYKFKSWLEREEECAMNVRKAIIESGLNFEIKKNHTYNTPVCFAALVRICKSSGYDVLKEVFTLVKQTWLGEKESMAKEIILGTYYFCKTYSYSPSTFIKALSTVAPKTIKREGDSDISINQGYMKYAKAMANHYDKRLSQKNKLTLK